MKMFQNLSEQILCRIFLSSTFCIKLVWQGRALCRCFSTLSLLLNFGRSSFQKFRNFRKWLRRRQQNISVQLSGFWRLSFYPLPLSSPLSGLHKKFKNFLIFHFKKQGSNLLEIPMQIAHSYYVSLSSFLRKSLVILQSYVILISKTLRPFLH